VRLRLRQARWLRHVADRQDHYALDFVGFATGDAVYPVADGTVLYAERATGGWAPYGNLVHIRHGDTGYTSMYAHLDAIDVTPGQEVTTSTAAWA
jgi:murein DD-endopeptidase MepM/ murein hydrolase activator NlpD